MISDKLDHQYINEIVTFNPTAENMAKLLYEKCKELLNWVDIDKVIIYETPTSFAEYSPQ